MAKGISKRNQKTAEISYRFGEFELNQGERILLRDGEPVTLAPKTFDALLCLVRNAEHLVSKSDLMDALWPSTHVSEANLTNTIVSLRKVLGQDAIRTVSKHGYRFVMPVQGEPGIAREIYEKFPRAKELTVQRSLESTTRARELYWLCLAENRLLHSDGLGSADAAGFSGSSVPTLRATLNSRMPPSGERS